MSGLFSGLGAAMADALYGFIAAFGLTFISNILIKGQMGIKLIGGIFLIYLGVRTFLSKTKIANNAKLPKSSLVKDFFTTFFLTITNPLTVLSFLAIFAGLGLSQGTENSVFLVAGVFIGSTLWWLLLCEFVTLFRKKIEEKMMGWINRGAGVIIFAFGVIAILTAIVR